MCYDVHQDFKVYGISSAATRIPDRVGYGANFFPRFVVLGRAPVAVLADKAPLALPAEPYGVDADTKFLIMVEMCFYKFLHRLWKCCEMCACF